LLYLAAAGVGHIGVVDADRVALSNLPRQILYETADVGRLKTDASQDALLDRNPTVSLTSYSTRLTVENAETLIAPYHLVADCSDNFSTRLIVNAACFHQKKPLISASVQGFLGQISTYKAYHGAGHPCYQCLLGGLPPEDTMPDCSKAGVLGTAAGMMGCWQATEVMKELLGIGESLSGVLLRYDALRATFQRATLQKDPSCLLCG
jgi:adenylyltransferase/sulfurtransferase